MKKMVLFLLLSQLIKGFSGEQLFVQNMGRYVPLSKTMKKTLKSMATQSTKCGVKDMHRIDRPLYRAYPAFHSQLSHSTLGDLPTPLSRLSQLEGHVNNSCKLFLKDDGVTGRLTNKGRTFGGNKIRKLEFLLADAIDNGVRSVMTYGGIGSNHVVATAVCAKYVGLRTIAMLSPQDVTEVVKRNMLLMHDNDVEMILNPNRETRGIQTVCSYVQSKYNHGDMPYFIPTGGSCSIGIVGFVNAAFELKEQIANGEMPEPDYIYVAVGSCGTIAGLTLGARAAGLKSKVIGVAVEPENELITFARMSITLIQETNDLLCKKDAAFPQFDWHEDDVQILNGFGGPDYGVVTQDALIAIDIFGQTENIQLDTTYTGKAAAGMLAEIKSGKRNGNVVLFWNTFCAHVPVPETHPDQLTRAFQ